MSFPRKRGRVPFLNPKLLKQKARLHRLKRKGLTPPPDKASVRKLIEQACLEHPIKVITTAPRDDHL